MVHRLLTAAMLTLLLPAAAMAEQENPAHGLWLTENGKAIVEFAPCGTETCGKMVWIANPRDAAGQIKRDVNNSDSAMRERPLCGLTLVGGLGPAEKGWIYNPRDGETYSVKVTPVSPLELKVRGFLGIELFGSSQTWTRVSSDRGGCGA